MKRIWAIVKKELRRFFTDYRMVLALVLPGIAIFLIYSFAGNIFTQTNITKIDKNYQFDVAISDNYNSESSDPSLIEQGLDQLMTYMEYAKPNYHYFSISDKNEMIDELKNKKYDAVIVFDDNFELGIFLPSSDPNQRPNVEVYYNSEMKESELFYSYVTQTMNQIYARYTINAGVDNPNVGEQSVLMNQIMGMIVPMVTMALLYSTILTVCPESIAGEKERGTLSSIMITPIKRSEFALGKIISLTIICLFGGVISGAGMILSLPKMIGGGTTINISPLAYVLLFFVLLSLVILFVNIATSISTFAKSVKEASGFLSPLIAILMIVGLVPGFFDCSSIGFAFIPVLNASQIIFSIINSNYDFLFLGLTLISNLVYAMLLVLLDVKLFKTESVVMRQ